MRPDAAALLTSITDEMKTNSDTLHRLTRRQKILQDAATMLRTGRTVAFVEAHLDEQLPHPAPVPLRRAK